jgi:hypothetical protein
MQKRPQTTGRTHCCCWAWIYVAFIGRLLLELEPLLVVVVSTEGVLVSKVQNAGQKLGAVGLTALGRA